MAIFSFFINVETEKTAIEKYSEVKKIDIGIGTYRQKGHLS